MDSLPLWTALAVCLAAAAVDLRSRRIPNVLTLGALAAGFVLQGALAGPAGLVHAFAGALAAGLPALAVFALRGMGGGDVKLLAACGALLGPAAALQLLLATAVAGGVLAAAAIAARRAWTVTGSYLQALALHWRRRGPVACPEVSLGRSRGIAVPYGVAIALGAAFTVASRAGAA
jgi:prepilin peptidase CpaA